MAYVLCGLVHPNGGIEKCNLMYGHSGPHSWELFERIRYVDRVCSCEVPKVGMMNQCVFCGGSIPVKIVTFQSGAASSKIPRFDLIPYEALCELANRFELGLERHKEKSWNARQNPQALEDREWVITRAAHAVHHALKYIEKFEGRLPEDGDDDAAAIMWAGACLIMAKKANAKTHQ